MENKKEDAFRDSGKTAEIAELSQACCEKIRECEHEINKLGCWNIALVAYQMKG